MTPKRLRECLAIIRWPPETLAQELECDVSLVNAWLSGDLEIPMKFGTWLGLFATVVQSAVAQKPVSLKGKRHKPPGDA